MENWANKEKFFKCPCPKERVAIPDVGDIWVHGLTSGQKDEYENDVFKVTAGSQEVKISNARAVLIQRTVRDQHGNPMFAAADIGKINQIPASILDPIYEKARKLSGMITGKKEVDELVKNSETPPASGSGID